MRIYANDPRFRQQVIEALAYELTVQENRIRVEEISIALRKASRTMLWSIGKVCLLSWNLYHHRAADVKLRSRLRCSFSIPFLRHVVMYQKVVFCRYNPAFLLFVNYSCVFHIYVNVTLYAGRGAGPCTCGRSAPQSVHFLHSKCTDWGALRPQVHGLYNVNLWLRWSTVK